MGTFERIFEGEEGLVPSGRGRQIAPKFEERVTEVRIIYGGVRETEARAMRFVSEREGNREVATEGTTAFEEVGRDIGVGGSNREISFR